MYCVARTRERALTKSYREYVTDSLQYMPQGKYMTHRWADLIKPHEDIDVDATIEHVISRLEAR